MSSLELSALSNFAAQLREAMARTLAATDPGTLHQTALAAESGFRKCALELFGLQFRHNVPYRGFCAARHVRPDGLGDWRDIPAMPTAAFKELELTSLPVAERTYAFHSSGTTEQRPSRHFHSDQSLALYEASLLAYFPACMLAEQDGRRPDFISLTPPQAHAPASSLVHMFEAVAAGRDSKFTGRIEEDGWVVDLAVTLAALGNSIARKRPVALVGTAFAFVQLLDHLAAAGKRLQLPSGSHVLETGGYKGRSKVLSKNELHWLIRDLLGVPAESIIGEYGMCELSSQAYSLQSSILNPQSSIFRFPPWARVQIVSPETGREVADGETGLIRVFDLANVWSVMAVQTEDLGIRRGDAFELIGRAALAEPRGCSLMSVQEVSR